MRHVLNKFSTQTVVDKQHGATLPPWYVIFYQIVSPFVIFVIIGYKSGPKPCLLFQKRHLNRSQFYFYYHIAPSLEIFNAKTLQ